LKIFIDGSEGTTGLQLAERLSGRDDLELLKIDSRNRKSFRHREALYRKADLVVLCLPDASSKEAVTAIDCKNTIIIDASSAHRVHPDWVYGFTEYESGHREVIRSSQRISNPGCYAIAAVAALFPIIKANQIPANWPYSITGLSGYSGGGKTLIESFKSGEHYDNKISNFDYSLEIDHKHLPEITQQAHLKHMPAFSPTVGNFYQGMVVRIHLPLWAFSEKTSPEIIHETYLSHYKDEQFIEVAPLNVAETKKYINPEELNGSNRMRLNILKDPKATNVVIVAQLDNLGKGASGQAMQTINLLSGADENYGL